MNIGKLIVIILLLFPLWLLMAAFMTIKALFIMALILLVTIVTGMFPYTCEIIGDQDCPLSGILLLFYPVTMIAGIVAAIGDFFCEAAGEEF